jgi:hypothetical protein
MVQQKRIQQEFFFTGDGEKTPRNGKSYPLVLYGWFGCLTKVAHIQNPKANFFSSPVVAFKG